MKSFFSSLDFLSSKTSCRKNYERRAFVGAKLNSFQSKHLSLHLFA